MNKEIWKPVFEYEGIYEVSNYGNVRSLDRVNERNHNLTGKAKAKVKLGRYYRVLLSKNGKKQLKQISMLVAESFLGHRPDGTTKLVVDHINNDSLNDMVDNLQVITHRENLLKNRLHKLKPIKDKNNNNKSGFRGVTANSHGFDAAIKIDYKSIYLGFFKTAEEAHEAYLKAKKKRKEQLFNKRYSTTLF